MTTKAQVESSRAVWMMIAGIFGISLLILSVVFFDLSSELGKVEQTNIQLGADIATAKADVQSWKRIAAEWKIAAETKKGKR